MGTLTYHGGPSRESCLGALAEVVSWGHAQHGHLQPGVDVDSPRQDHQAVGINRSDAPRDDEVLSNLSGSNRKRCRWLGSAAQNTNRLHGNTEKLGSVRLVYGAWKGVTQPGLSRTPVDCQRAGHPVK